MASYDEDIENLLYLGEERRAEPHVVHHHKHHNYHHQTHHNYPPRTGGWVNKFSLGAAASIGTGVLLSSAARDLYRYGKNYLSSYFGPPSSGGRVSSFVRRRNYHYRKVPQSGSVRPVRRASPRRRFYRPGYHRSRRPMWRDWVRSRYPGTWQSRFKRTMKSRIRTWNPRRKIGSKPGHWEPYKNMGPRPASLSLLGSRNGRVPDALRTQAGFRKAITQGYEESGYREPEIIDIGTAPLQLNPRVSHTYLIPHPDKFHEGYYTYSEGTKEQADAYVKEHPDTLKQYYSYTAGDNNYYYSTSKYTPGKDVYVKAGWSDKNNLPESVSGKKWTDG